MEDRDGTRALGATPTNSQTARLFVIAALVCAIAFSGSLGKQSADEYSAQTKLSHFVMLGFG